MNAILTIGLSCSGKHTFAQSWVAENPAGRVEINRILIRAEHIRMEGRPFPLNGWGLSFEQEDAVSGIQKAMLADAAERGLDVIISDANLHGATRAKKIKMLEDMGFEVEIKEFPTSLEKAFFNNSQRSHQVSIAALEDQEAMWLEYLQSKLDTAVPTVQPAFC